MAISDVVCAEAERLMREEGYAYLDVRSVHEFEAGHPAGAYNIPVMEPGPAGMQPNPNFLASVQGAFEKDAKIVLGCQAGGRSLRACNILHDAGFTNVKNVAGGFGGGQDSQGNPANGWRDSGLPVANQPEEGRHYNSLKK